MNSTALQQGVELLASRFPHYDWTYHDVPAKGGGHEKAFRWFGPDDEEIMVCVHKGYGLHEHFHRHDFYFFNYAYRGDYDALSAASDHRITIREGELYVGQPFTGYALVGNDAEEVTIIGVLIRKETFFKSFLPVASASDKLLRFFTAPSADAYSDEYILTHAGRGSVIETLLETMVQEYAFAREDTQSILKPLTLALIMYTARQVAGERLAAPPNRTVSEIVRYIGEHAGRTSLRQVAQLYGYHPNYLSALLHKELGKTFSQIVLEQRMSRAAALLRGTNLSIEEIAAMLGYGNSSNFYKSYRRFFGKAPRQKETPQSPTGD